MGVSTDGVIGFGVLCGEEGEFPWDADDFEGDWEDWWRVQTGYEPIHGEPWADTESGYAPGWSRNDPRISEHFDHQRKWDKDHPCPVEPVNYCSDNCAMYALVVPSSHLECSRGYPKTFDPATLRVSDLEVEALVGFLEKHEIETEDGKPPRWLLMSYWG